ncbi:MAG TPA: methyltransferase, partial [Ignavibacteriaceae bacterium]
DALELARKNSALNGTIDRVKFFHNDILNDGEVGNDFDVIVSNPPYVSGKDFERLRPELKIYEPRRALTDDADGLIYYRKILSKADRLLKSGGRLFFEIGQGQSASVKDIFEEYNFTAIRIKNDYLNIERVISGVLN